MRSRSPVTLTGILFCVLASTSCSLPSRCSPDDVFCNPLLALLIYTKLPRFAYTANYSAQTISMYTVDPATGLLTAKGAVAMPNPFTVLADPLGQFLYATSETTSSGRVFAINQVTGTLESAGTFSAGANPTGIYRQGGFAFVVNTGSAAVSTYQADRATGALSALSSVPVVNNPYRMAFGPGGRFAYVAQSGTNTIAQFAVNPETGALSSLGTAPSGGNNPFDIATHPSGSFVYTTNNSVANVSMLSVNADGTLTANATIGAGNSPFYALAHPSGRFLYVANFGGATISMYTVDQSTGTLASIGSAQAGTSPYFLATDISGRFVYAANDGSGSVSMYQVNLVTGELVPTGTIAAGALSRSITIVSF